MSIVDRRAAERRRCLVGAVLLVGPVKSQGALLDLSDHGCYLACETHPATGVEVGIRFRHPDTDRPIRRRAIVARQIRRSSGAPSDGVGLQFAVPLGSDASEDPPAD